MKRNFLLAVMLLFCNFTSFVQGVESTPVMARAYGDRFVGQEATDQQLGTIGALDDTFGVNGSLSVDSELSGGMARSILALADGKFLVGLNSSGAEYIVKYTALGTVDTSFGAAGIYDLTDVHPVHAIVEDIHGRILVAGGATGSLDGYLRRVDADGVSNPVTVVNDAVWYFIGDVALQTSGNIITVGFDGTNAMIARYTQGTATTAGVLDTTFGSSGYIVFDGTNGLTSTNGLYSVVVDSSDNIYVLYLDDTDAKVAKFGDDGALVSGWATSGIQAVSGLNSATASTMRIALASNDDLILAAQVGTNIIVRSITSAAATAGSYANFTTALAIGNDTRDLQSLLTTSDGKVFLVGSNVTDKKSSVIRLTSAGALDTDFNTIGYNEFSMTSPDADTSSVLYASTVAPDGRIYVAGYQVHSATTTSYVSRLYNDIYVSQVAQFPVVSNEGLLDITFGSAESVDGVVRAYNGLYGVSLQQTADRVIELASGKLLVGMSGKLDDSANSNMILKVLNADGTADETFNLGKIYTDEYLTGVVEGNGGNFYVSGYATDRANLRKYNNSGGEQWTVSETNTNYKGLGVTLQGTDRVLLFKQISSTQGGISAYNQSSGALVTAFGNNGYISPADFGLTNMGPLYAYTLDDYDNIIIAYRNISTGAVDVAKIYADGSGLVTEFGSNGIKAGVFGATTITNPQDVRCALDDKERIIIAIATGTDYRVHALLSVTGEVDTSFGTAGTLTISSVGTAVVLNKITTLSNDKIILTGADNATDDSMLLVKILSTGALDTAFNSQGETAGILSLQHGNIIADYYARVATDVVVQASTGDLIVSGYEQATATSSIPMVLRVHGEAGTTQVAQFHKNGTVGISGVLDASFGTDGAYDFTSLIAAGAAKVVYAYESGNANQGYLLVGIDTSASAGTIIARVNENTLALDTSFGSGTGKVTLSGSVAGVQHIQVDNDNRILVTGSTGGTAGWAHCLSNDGTVDVVFNTTGFTSIKDLKQQKSGRYIVSGINSTNSKGVIAAFKDELSGAETQLQIDTTFNPLAATTLATAGWYEVTATTEVPSLVINSDDTIVAAYADTTVKALKLTASGSGLVSGFGSSGVKDSGIIPTNASSIRCALDSNGSFVFASSVGGDSVSVVRYESDGSTDATFNSDGSVLNITGLGSAGVSLARLVIDENNKIIVLGNNTVAGYGSNGNLYAVRLDETGALDTTWNITPTGADVAGILTYTIDGSTNCYDATIYIDGSIYAVGVGTTNKPLMVSILGDDHATEFAQQPFESAAGVVDTTLDSSGALNLDTYLSTIDLSLSTAKKLHIYDDGSMLVAFNQGTSTILVKLNKDLSLDTAGFGLGTGYVTIENADTVTDMFVNNGANADGYIYLTGTNSGSLWTAQISAAGVDQSMSITDALSMTVVTGIRRTTNSRTLISGKTASTGIVAAYKSDGSGLDLSFGSGTGYYATGENSAVFDMALDQYDSLYIARFDGTGQALVDCVLADGTGLNMNFSLGTGISTLSAPTGIKIAVDTDNNQLVMAVQDGTGIGNNIRVRRYNTATGGNTAGQIDILIHAGVSKVLSELFIDSEENIYVVGYNSAASNVFAVRIASTSSTTIAVDTTYGSSGVVNSSAGANLTVVRAAALHPDRRIYVVGSEATPTPAMARLFGDDYVTQVSNAYEAGDVGVVDISIDVDNAGVKYLDGGTSNSVTSIFVNNDGSYFIAMSNNTELLVGKYNASFELDTSFGDSSSGVTAALNMATVHSLTVDAQGRILVAGTDSGAQKVVRFAADGTAVTVFNSGLGATVGTKVVEQKSGRILVAGKIGLSGSINAYKNTGLLDDTTYGSNGYYATGVDAQVDDMVIDQYDIVYLVYRDASNKVTIEKITANGSTKVAAFNSGLAVDTGITATNSARIAINNAGDILVGATTASGVMTRLYDGETGAALSVAQTITNSNSPVITALASVGSDFFGAMYTNIPTIILCKVLGVDGALDSSFPIAGLSEVGGNLLTVEALAIQKDGRILLGGESASNAAVTRFYADPYDVETAQSYSAAEVGTLDPTFATNLLRTPTDSVNLDTLLSSGGLDLDAAAVKRIHIYNDGSMLLVCENTTDTIVVRALTDLTLDTSFNTNGYVIIAGKTDARGLCVNGVGKIFVAGGATTSWARAFNPDGTSLTDWVDPTSNMTSGAYEIAQQSPYRVILAGQNTNGALYGYTNGGVLDSSFGTSGEVSTGVAAPITDMTIDSLDRIVIVYSNAGTAVLQRVSSGGETVSTLSAGTAITNITDNEVRVIHDNVGNIIVAAATSSGFELRRYAAADGADDANLTIAVGGTAHLGNVYATSDGKITLVGYDDDTTDKVVVARLNSSFALDFGFNSGAALSTAVTDMNLVYDGTIHPDNRIIIAGGSTTAADPFLARVYGDDYVNVVDQFPGEGVPGTLDTTFATSGAFNLGALDASVLNSQAKAVMTLVDGSHYIAFDNGSSASHLIRITSANILDVSYSTDGIADAAPEGVHSMILDGAGRVILTGTDTAGNGWVQRYTTDGDADTTFDGSGLISGEMSVATVTVEQTLGRLVVAGKRTNGVVRAYTDAGVLDTTFNSLGSTPGEFSLSANTNAIYAMVADEYDRLIIAYLSATGDAIDLARLSSNGELDETFGTAGIVAGVIEGADDATQVRVVLNTAGNIVVAAHINDGANKVAVKSYDNLLASSGNGVVVNAQYNVSFLVGPSLKNVIATNDGHVLVLGSQTLGNPMWLARLVLAGTSTITLDTAGFNPNALGGIAGIFQYAGGGTTEHIYNAVASRTDGRLSIVGYENSTGTFTPYLLRAYSDPYVIEEEQFPGAQAIGGRDETLGVTTDTDDRITFFASTGADETQEQVARAIALQGNNKIVVACDGQSTADNASRVFLNQFTVDGVLDTTFNTTGQVEVPHVYAHEHVRDMIVFSQDGVNKAILAGYASSGSPLNVTNSWLMQYNLTTPGVDTSFGGKYQDGSGTAFGDIQELHTVGRQSTGKIVVSGLNYDSVGTVVGYTSNGLLDKSFGSDGFFFSSSTNGIYTHVIDSSNRIVFAYRDGSNNLIISRLLSDGSGLDSTFGTAGTITTAVVVSADNQVRVAIDQNGKIVVAVQVGSTANYIINRYTSAGILDVTLTISAADLGAITSATLAQLLIDAQGKAVIVGSVTDGSGNWMITVRTQADLSGLDTTFNTNGYLKYEVDSVATDRYLTDAVIHADGRILAVGSESQIIT